MGQGRGGGGDLERAAAEDKTPAERGGGGDGRDAGGAGGERARHKTAGDSGRSRGGFRKSAARWLPSPRAEAELRVCLFQLQKPLLRLLGL